MFIVIEKSNSSSSVRSAMSTSRPSGASSLAGVAGYKHFVPTGLILDL